MTERAEYTAGPWVIPDTSWEPWEGAIEVRSKDDDVICYTSSGHGREKFDARLISAAPELLDALRNFTEGRHISYVAALEAARAAIAKATGEA